MEDRALNLIRSYIYELPEPRLRLPRGMFEQRSYSRWAAEEIQLRLMNESMLLPPHISGREHRSYMEIIEEFIQQMDYFSCLAKDPDTSVIFSIAKDTAEDIYDYFQAAN